MREYHKMIIMMTDVNSKAPLMGLGRARYMIGAGINHKLTGAPRASLLHSQGKKIG